MSTSVFSEKQTPFCFSYADAELRSDIKWIFPEQGYKRTTWSSFHNLNCTAKCYKQLAANQWLRELNPVKACFMQHWPAS